MKTYLEANFQTARAAYLAQVAWMQQKNLADAERKGGVVYLREHSQTDDAKRFLGIERRLIELAAFEDAAMDYINELSNVLEAQAQTIHALNAELRDYKRKEKPPLEAYDAIPHREYLQMMILCSRIPKRIGALMDAREGRREASKIYAATTQKHLF